MVREYKPVPEVMDFAEKMFKTMQETGNLEESMHALSEGRVNNLEEAMAEIRQGTKFGKAVYSLAERFYCDLNKI